MSRPAIPPMSSCHWSRESVIRERDRLERAMTTAQIARATELAHACMDSNFRRYGR